MRYRPLGSSGLVVSVAGLGCNNFGRRLDVAATRAVVDAAIDAGVTLLDTADTYGGAGRSEEILGEVLAGRRDQVVLATKFGNQGADMGYGPAAGAKGGRAYIRRAVEESLRRLRTDHIDLYQLHTPDPRTPIEETLSALGELVAEGKVRYIGHSNFAGWQIADGRGRGPRAGHRAVRLGPEPLVAAGARGRGGGRARRRALRARRAALLPAGQRPAHRQGPARPRAREGTRLHRPGRLHHRGEAGQGGGAGRSGPSSTAGRCSRWPSARLAALPGCTSVIAGATSPEQVRANAAASDWVPEDDELAEIDKIVPPEVRLGTTPLTP